MAVAPSNETTGAHRCSFSRHRSSYIQHTSIADAMYSHYERLYTSYAEALLVLCWFCAGRSPGLCWFRCFVLVLCWSLLVSAGFAVLCWFCNGFCWSLPVSRFCAGFCAGLCWSLPVSLFCAGFVLVSLLVSARFAVLCWSCAGLCRFRYFVQVL